MNEPSFGTVVVVGASLAGLRAAEALRQDGFTGRIVMVGEECHLPYDRPPLSKQFLARAWDFNKILLRSREQIAALEAEWWLGWQAGGLDISARKVSLKKVVTSQLDPVEMFGDYSGQAQLHSPGCMGEPGQKAGVESDLEVTELEYDGLVIATGAFPRRLPGCSELEGVYTLRRLEDSQALATRMETAGLKVVVVGAGFIGSEVASTAVARGAQVVLIEAAAVPLAGVLGEEIGRACVELHRAHGVDVRTGVGVASIEGKERLERVVLADATTISADVVVVGLGVSPATSWLEGSGLDLNDGVVCDPCLMAGPSVAAAGDVARWYHPGIGEEIRIEHWTNAAEQGAAAASNLLRAPAERKAYSPVPYFWSDQHGVKIQYLGRSRPGDDMRVVEGSIKEGKFVAVYGRAGRLTAAVGFGRPRQLMAYRRPLAEGASWEEALALGP
ncbi:MAG: FAD-dependent oxidoreductase [Actinobacteria bacterium]|nr:FAD-dependent oxidoreductase [Actinomycetota bacterium]